MTTAAVCSAPRTVSTLQIGMQWFPERGGGLDRIYYDLMRMLPAAGVGFRGLVAGSERVALDAGGAVRAFAPSDANMLKRWSALRHTVRRELAATRFDLVVAHFALYAYPVRRLIAQHGLPLVVHFHGPWAAESREEGAGRAAAWTKAALERRVYARAERLIVLSEPFARILIENYGISENLIRRVPPGLETARFRTDLTRAQAREKLGWPVDRPIVIAVRRLVNRMGLEDLIAAAAEVRREVSDVLFVIAGRGPLAATLEKQIKSRDLCGHVRLLGFVPDADLPLAYVAADLTVVPTVALEGFGLIVIESLAAGTPVMVTPIGGLPDGVIGLAPQLVLPTTGPAALAQGLAAALRGRLPIPSRRQCEQHAQANFDWSVISKRVRAVYEEALR